MKGYKAFAPGLVCRGKQYAENTVFEEEKASIYKSGMHFCPNPFDVLDHYPLVNADGSFSDFAEVEALGEVCTDDEKKYCTKKLRIGAKLSFAGFVRACVSFVIEKTVKNMPSGEGSSGYSARIGSSGYSARIGSSGDYARIGSSGDSAQIGSSGDYARIGSSGDYARIGSSGYSARIGSSGDSARIGSSGDSAQIGSSGDYAQIGSSGDSARIGSSGYSARIGSSGDYAQIASSGIETVLEYAGNLPVADVAPVVHGRWKHYRDTIICSRCSFGMYPLLYYFRDGECAGGDLEPRFCPNCGAKMEVDHD